MSPSNYMSAGRQCLQIDQSDAIRHTRTRICVSPMSSGLCEWGCLGVCEEGSVDDVGEFAFEESEGFSFG